MKFGAIETGQNRIQPKFGAIETGQNRIQPKEILSGAD